MTDPEAYMRDWWLAARSAGFRPLVVVKPAPSKTWVGGMSTSSDGGLQIEISHLIGGNEIAVSTRRGRSTPDLRHQIRRAADAVIEDLLDRLPELPVRLEATFCITRQEVRVDGRPLTFSGVVEEGSDSFELYAEAGHELITLSVSGGVVPQELTRSSEFEQVSRSST